MNVKYLSIIFNHMIEHFLLSKKKNNQMVVCIPFLDQTNRGSSSNCRLIHFVLIWKRVDMVRQSSLGQKERKGKVCLSVLLHFDGVSWWFVAPSSAVIRSARNRRRRLNHLSRNPTVTIVMDQVSTQNGIFGYVSRI